MKMKSRPRKSRPQMEENSVGVSTYNVPGYVRFIICPTAEGMQPEVEALWELTNAELAKLSSVKLLQLCFYKWAFILKYIKKTGILPEDGTHKTCALCKAYSNNFAVGSNCEICPIGRTTGKGACFGTPYYDYHYAASCRSNEIALIACKEEVKFLKHLIGLAKLGVIE